MNPHFAPARCNRGFRLGAFPPNLVKGKHGFSEGGESARSPGVRRSRPARRTPPRGARSAVREACAGGDRRAAGRCRRRALRVAANDRAKKETGCASGACLAAVAARAFDRVPDLVQRDLAVGRGEQVDAQLVGQLDQVQQDVRRLERDLRASRVARRPARGSVPPSSTGSAPAVRPPPPTARRRGSWANGTGPSRARARRRAGGRARRGGRWSCAGA